MLRQPGMVNDPNSVDVTLRLRKDALQWREVEDEVIALEGRSASYLAANKTGAILWHELAEGTTRERLIAGLVEEFEIDEAQASQDVDAFLAELTKHDLLEKKS
jgi:hypothetical protein